MSDKTFEQFEYEYLRQKNTIPAITGQQYAEDVREAKEYATKKMEEQAAAFKKLASGAGGTGNSQFDVGKGSGFMGFSDPRNRGGNRRRKSRKLKSRRRRVKSRRF